VTGPPTWPQQPGLPPQQPGRPGPPGRPADVDTGFWLWLAALPVMTTVYVVSVVTSQAVVSRTGLLYPIIALIAVIVCAVVVTFLVLMRAGYRWARTTLTGGGVAAVVYAVTGLFDPDPRPVTAVLAAVTGIVGSVLIVGGTFLLHRSDAQGYFTR
jgi:hypothetical protein